jgi:hypothetical protein
MTARFTSVHLASALRGYDNLNQFAARLHEAEKFDELAKFLGPYGKDMLEKDRCADMPALLDGIDTMEGEWPREAMPNTSMQSCTDMRSP